MSRGRLAFSPGLRLELTLLAFMLGIEIKPFLGKLQCLSPLYVAACEFGRNTHTHTRTHAYRYIIQMRQITYKYNLN